MLLTTNDKPTTAQLQPWQKKRQRPKNDTSARTTLFRGRFLSMADLKRTVSYRALVTLLRACLSSMPPSNSVVTSTTTGSTCYSTYPVSTDSAKTSNHKNTPSRPYRATCRAAWLHPQAWAGYVPATVHAKEEKKTNERAKEQKNIPSVSWYQKSHRPWSIDRSVVITFLP